jgi:transcriptional regulator
MEKMTLRQRIMAELEKGSLTVRDLSKAIRISEKEVIAHMEHVAKSLKPPRRLIIEPSVCNKCGFVFYDRRRFSSPSRCPGCRHEGISPPAFRIIET